MLSRCRPGPVIESSAPGLADLIVNGENREGPGGGRPGNVTNRLIPRMVRPAEGRHRAADVCNLNCDALSSYLNNEVVDDQKRVSRS